MIIPGVLLVSVGVFLWMRVNSISGAIFTGVGLAWVVLELALGPTAMSRIRTVGATVDLPLVKRMRNAQKILTIIDAAVRAARGIIEQPNAPAHTSSPTSPNAQTTTESPTASFAAVTQTNAF